MGACCLPALLRRAAGVLLFPCVVARLDLARRAIRPRCAGQGLHRSERRICHLRFRPAVDCPNAPPNAPMDQSRGLVAGDVVSDELSLSRDRSHDIGGDGGAAPAIRVSTIWMEKRRSRYPCGDAVCARDLAILAISALTLGRHAAGDRALLV